VACLRQWTFTVCAWVAIAFLSTSACAQGTPDRDPLSQFSQSLARLTSRVSPAVVEILNAGYVSEKDDDGNSSYSKQEIIGSGVIIDTDGYIMTNAHVIRAAKRIRVVLNTASSLAANPMSRGEMLQYDATIVGAHEDTDLALLKINAVHLPAIPLADYSSVQQGEIVIAVGSPLGMKDSVSMGIISSVARQPEENKPIVLIQTDAALNPGNSGGALVDTEGRLVGITCQTMGERLGFAVPSDVVKRVYQQIRKYGTVRRGDIGVEAQDITPLIARGLRLPRSSGVLVAGVKPGSPAQKLGIKATDVILFVDGKAVASVPEFQSALYFKEDTDRVRLEIQRDRKTLNLDLPVTTQPMSLTDPMLGADPEKRLVRRLGIFAETLDKNDREQAKTLRDPVGVNVAAKLADIQALGCDLRPGDVIHSVNGASVSDLDSLRQAINKLNSGDAVVLLVERNQKYLFLGFEID
jgi:serine protease Do